MKAIRALVLITAVVAALLGVVATASVLSGSGGGAAERPRIMTSQAHYVWGDTPRDWVSWADRIAVIDVVGEEQVPFEPTEFEGGSGWVARRVHARIAETIWSRPGASNLPSSVKVRTTDGWWYTEGELTPIKDLGAHRGEVGDRLVVALMHSPKWGWMLMSGGVPVAADARLHADHDQTGIAEQLDGLGLPQLRRTFRSAQPFAGVVRFRHLDVEERMIAVHEYAQRTGARIAG